MSLINKAKIGDRDNGLFTSPTISVSTTNPAQVSAYSGGYDLNTGEIPDRHYRIGLADLQGLGAFTTGDIIFHICDPGQITLWTLVKPYIALTDAVGGSGAAVALSAATARILSVPLNSAANASATNSYGTAYDVFQAVGTTVFDFDGTHPHVETMAVQSQFILRVTTTGANLSALTNGAIDLWINYANVSV